MLKTAEQIADEVLEKVAFSLLPVSFLGAERIRKEIEKTPQPKGLLGKVMDATPPGLAARFITGKSPGTALEKNLEMMPQPSLPRDSLVRKFMGNPFVPSAAGYEAVARIPEPAKTIVPQGGPPAPKRSALPRRITPREK